MTTVGLVQINNSFSEANYLPLSVGLLQAYAQEYCQNPEDLHFLPALYSRTNVAESVARLQGAQIVGFSAYCWNIKISTAIAARLKSENPDILIVFGGPQVPDRCEEFLRQYPFIDLCVHGEGEPIFAHILDAYRAGQDWSELPSVSYLDRQGAFVTQTKAKRLRDLNQIPSPFLGGVFQQLMQENPDQAWLGLWETNRGCPFSCTFCDWGSATQAKVFQFDLERLKQEIEWFAANKVEFIFCCDANFGILPRDLEIAEQVARTKQATGYPQALSVQNTKNATQRAYQVQKTLAVAGLNKGVTLSMQSMDPHTLKMIRRDNISIGSYQELQRRFTGDRIETYSDMILALPGETYETFVAGVDAIMRNGQHNRIQFNNLGILPNAEMGDPEYQKRFGMRSVETRLVNIHGSLAENEDDIFETQDLVVATDSMPAEDWVKTRSFCWMTAFLHFDKVFQLPILAAHQLGGVPFERILSRFANLQDTRYPVLSGLVSFFRQTAQDIQNGATEYVQSKEWLNIYWPADEYALIELVRSHKLPQFYSESLAVLKDCLEEPLDSDLLEQAARLNEALLKQPFVHNDLEIELSYNLWDIYQGALLGEKVELTHGKWAHRIDRSSKTWDRWDDWYREVVWYGNKKGAYLYGSQVVQAQLEGHF